MRFRWIWAIGYLILLTACGGDSDAPKVVMTPTRLATPAFGGSGAVLLPGCQFNDLTNWEWSFTLPSEGAAVEAIRQLESLFEAVNYPQCVRTARARALEVYNYAALAAAATAQGDTETANEHRANFKVALMEFETEMRNVREQITEPPTPAPTELATCPDIRATCSDNLTCSEAHACYLAGNKSLDGDGDGVPCDTACNE